MNEREIIDHIASLGRLQAVPDLLKGIGDDCAVVNRDGERAWLLTMDTLIESVHFDCSFHPPLKLGRKAVSVNVSDVGAMGGRPLFALLSVGMPPTFDADWFCRFSQGLAEACRDYGVFLIGGDTVKSPQGLNFSLTLIGEARTDQVVYRSGARVGDTLWVSGPLGWAAAGLHLLQQGKGGVEEFTPLYERHLNPEARVHFGACLGASGLAHAMMDLSDGLATDLAHLCKASGVGASFEAEKMPGSQLLDRAAGTAGGHDPIAWAISGGEDFELLFTAAPTSADQIYKLGQQCGLTPTPIGRITSSQGVRMLRRGSKGGMVEESVAFKGFDHFREPFA